MYITYNPLNQRWKNVVRDRFKLVRYHTKDIFNNMRLIPSEIS
jgi:hypothetical protein